MNRIVRWFAKQLAPYGVACVKTHEEQTVLTVWDSRGLNTQLTLSQMRMFQEMGQDVVLFDSLGQRWSLHLETFPVDEVELFRHVRLTR
jgi:hypothetical protein